MLKVMPPCSCWKKSNRYNVQNLKIFMIMGFSSWKVSIKYSYILKSFSNKVLSPRLADLALHKALTERVSVVLWNPIKDVLIIKLYAKRYPRYEMCNTKLP